MALKDKTSKQLSGVEKAAVIMMSVDENNMAKIMSKLDETEIKDLSHAMSSLGAVPSDIIEQLFAEFFDSLSQNSSFVGNLENTERLLNKVLGSERVDGIMEEIRGPAGRNTWDKLGNVNEELLASYLKNEYPQTVALIVSKIPPEHSAKVLSVLPDDFSFEVIMRMLTMEAVKKEVLESVESTLRSEFISNLTKTRKLDSSQLMAEIFNNFDRANEAKYMSMLEERVPDTAEKIKSLMFTFDDLIKVDSAGIQALIRSVDKSKLAIALKGTNDKVKDLFLSAMSTRAAKILSEDMENMGPVRLRDVDDAQTEIINVCKDLINKGEVVISDSNDEGDQLIY